MVFKKGHKVSTDKKIDMKTGRVRTYPEKVGVRIPKVAYVSEEAQFARPPYFALFQSGWLKLALCTVHIYYGDDDEKGPRMARRKAEIAKIAQALGKRAQR